MRRFAALYQALDASTSTTDKVAALRGYFQAAAPADAAWAVYFLAGGKPRQVVPVAVLRALACEAAGIEDWLFEECYQAVGDLAETIAHVLPTTGRPAVEGLAYWVEHRLLPLRGLPPDEQAHRIREAWAPLDAASRFLLVKLVGGGFRVGVSKLLLQRALAQWAGLEPTLVAQRMMGYTDARSRPDAAAFLRLVSRPEQADPDSGQPYPFFLAHPLPAGLPPGSGDADGTGAPAPGLGPASDWQVEWKYDGIRAQMVRRGNSVWIWSRGEELITERFPEVVQAAQVLPPGTVLDGELLAWSPGHERPAPFQRLQQRITRKTLTRRILSDVPVRFLAYDVLEHDGKDVRDQPQHWRRAQLEALLAGSPVAPTPLLHAADWGSLSRERARALDQGMEGLMLKHRDARYGVGRRKQEGLSGGTWWKWKIDPMSVDGVLIYAQAGHGRRAGVYTDYTFAVWSRPPRDAAEAQAVVEAIARREPARPDALQLVPFTKAYSGLTDAEFAEVDREIRRHTLERFGPVRSVRPTLVFELGFEGIQASPRHKSGIALRFPRILRLRADKPLHEADALPTLLALVNRDGLTQEPAPQA